jgi:hypothetical protein
MGCGFVRLSQKVRIGLVSVFVIVSALASSAAGAEVYDDFSGENIDTTKWTIRSSPGGLPGLSIYTGGKYDSYLQIPVIPPKK